MTRIIQSCFLHFVSVLHGHYGHYDIPVRYYILFGSGTVRISPSSYLPSFRSTAYRLFQIVSLHVLFFVLLSSILTFVQFLVHWHISLSRYHKLSIFDIRLSVCENLTVWKWNTRTAMKYYEKSHNNDFRRVGCVFHDDTLVEESQENLAAFENWKFVVTGKPLFIHWPNLRILSCLSFFRTTCCVNPE